MPLSREESEDLFTLIMKTRGEGSIDPVGDALIAALVRCRNEPTPEQIRKEALRDAAAYILDRADQYVDGSGCWVALADASHNIMLGEVDAAKNNGDLDPSLYARVDGFSKGKKPKKPKEVVPTMGMDPDLDVGVDER